MSKGMILFAGCWALSGCGSLSGYDAKSKFACQAPNGVSCASMSAVYATKVLKQPKPIGKVETPLLAQPGQQPGLLTPVLESGTPIRSSPRILRIWVAPWEDREGVLHDQSYLYLPVDSGHWLIEHNQRRLMQSYPALAPSVGEPRPPSTFQAASAVTQRQQPEKVRSTVSGVVRSRSGEAVDVGMRQSRPSEEESAKFFEGIRTPQEALSHQGA